MNNHFPRRDADVRRTTQVGRGRRVHFAMVAAVLASASACSVLVETGGLANDAPACNGSTCDAGQTKAADADSATKVPPPAEASIDASVPDATALAPVPVFFLAGTQLPDGSVTTAPGMAYVDDGGAREIGCQRTSTGSIYYERISYYEGAVDNGSPGFVGTIANTAFYGTAPGTSKFAYIADGDGYPVYVADESTACDASAPVRADVNLPARPSSRMFPRFSPDGKRIAFLDVSVTEVWRVVTVGVDGSDPHVIQDRSQLPNDVHFEATPPSWFGNDVLWVQDDAQGIQVMRATDTAVPTIVGRPFSCPRSSVRNVRQIAFAYTVPPQAVIVLDGVPTTDAGPTDFYTSVVLAPTGTDGYCPDTLIKSISPTVPGAVSRDVAVSPGSTHIAFATNQPGGTHTASSPLHIAIADSAGLSVVTCGTPDPNVDDMGPQWLAGGTKLLWTRIEREDAAAPAPGGMMIADVVDGKCANVRHVVTNSDLDGTKTVFIGSGNSCAVSRAGSSREAMTGAGLAVVALAAALRRRRGTGRR